MILYFIGLTTGLLAGLVSAITVMVIVRRTNDDR